MPRPPPIRLRAAEIDETLPDAERREILIAMAASVALAGAGCARAPDEAIVAAPAAREYGPAGEPLFYATSFVRDGYAHGVLVETAEGRPIKVEGNPRHPASLGATDVFAQASVLQLWDPDRSQAPLRKAAPGSWAAFETELQPRLDRFDRNRGAGLAVLTGATTSPTLDAQLEALLAKYPQARRYRHEPLHDRARDAAVAEVFGRRLRPLYRLQRAHIVVTLDADVLSHDPASLRHARELAQRRARGTRWYAVESAPGLVGAAADRRLALKPPQIEAFIARLTRALGASAVANAEADAGLDARARSWADALAGQLRARPGAGLLVPGATLSTAAQAQLLRLNAQIGALGRTLELIEPPDAAAAPVGELIDAMRDGAVETLLILGGNPAYDTPAAAGFADALRRVPFSVHLSLYVDETSRLATWHLPQTHDYEQWSDARAWDGTAGIVQPVIAPLYAGRSVHELIARLARDPLRHGHAIVQRHWRRQRAADFDDFWRETLRRGVVAGSAFAPVTGVRLRETPAPAPAVVGGLVAVFAPDPSAGAGAFANNAWLQELPRPFTKLTWDNAALLAPATARRLDLHNGDVVRVTIEQRAVEAPVLTLPGQAEDTIVLPLGYGRRAAGRVGTGVGFDAYAVQPLAADGVPRAWAPATLEKQARRHRFAITQPHARMEGRAPVRIVDAVHAPVRAETPQHSLYPPYAYDSYAWGMSIDLDACIGCGACTIACQAENNVPVVGKQQVLKSREMHWIRVDRYHDGPEHATRTVFQPVPCMHCEHAPCEPVCPFGATMHDSEGLNVQVYNRCAGTRYCSNNCPYKVRRFNYLWYSNQKAETLKALQNPEVTVRRRGVMEKCTYCLQRISRARIEAETQNRRIRDGEVVTACQAVCPTQAIVFGDLNDPDSRVNRAKASPRDYALLAELNTRPRTTYLARIEDPQADLAALRRGGRQ